MSSRTLSFTDATSSHSNNTESKLNFSEIETSMRAIQLLIEQSNYEAIRLIPIKQEQIAEKDIWTFPPEDAAAIEALKQSGLIKKEE